MCSSASRALGQSHLSNLDLRQAPMCIPSGQKVSEVFCAAFDSDAPWLLGIATPLRRLCFAKKVWKIDFSKISRIPPGGYEKLSWGPRDYQKLPPGPRDFVPLVACFDPAKGCKRVAEGLPQASLTDLVVLASGWQPTLVLRSMFKIDFEHILLLKCVLSITAFQ